MKRARLHHLLKAPRAVRAPRGDSGPAPLPQPEDRVQAPEAITSWEQVIAFHSARNDREGR